MHTVKSQSIEPFSFVFLIQKVEEKVCFREEAIPRFAATETDLSQLSDPRCASRART